MFPTRLPNRSNSIRICVNILTLLQDLLFARERPLFLVGMRVDISQHFAEANFDRRDGSTAVGLRAGRCQSFRYWPRDCDRTGCRRAFHTVCRTGGVPGAVVGTQGACQGIRIQHNADTAICQSIRSPASHFAVHVSLSMSASKNSRSSHACTSR